MSVGSYFKPSAGGGMISIQSSAADFQAFQDFAKVVPKAAAAAHRRAINKTLGWLRTHIARAVSRSERIAVAAVRQRLRSYPVSGGAATGGHRAVRVVVPVEMLAGCADPDVGLVAVDLLEESPLVTPPRY